MSTHDYEIISRYVDGEMDAGEMKAFEELLQRDAELRNEVSLYKEVNGTLKSKLHPSKEELALRSTLEQMNGQYFKPQAKVVTMRQKSWWSAAAVAAVLVIATMIWAPWKQDLYRQYAAIEMTTAAERGAPEDSLLVKATRDFNEKRFREAIPSLQALIRSDSTNTYTRFYYGIALLEVGQAEKSRQEMAQLFNGTSIFRYDAAFYIALSYLKENNKAVSKEWLQKIPADAGIYAKAQELSGKL
jgi:hypothetical protein